MSNKIINSRIQIKKDNSINWEINNPVLLDGEIAIVKMTDSIKLKIGDGATNYIDLPFFLDDVLTEMENKIKSASTIPSGMIMIWSGSQSDIPNGWVLCNGQNNTPDLTDKFVIGAGTSYNVNDQGGEAAHTLTKEEMPSHNHTGTTGGAGGHKHTIGTDKDTYYVTAGDCWSVHNSATGASYYNGSTNWINDHTHSFTTSNVGGDQAHNNMPPYYALCYIMKI